MVRFVACLLLGVSSVSARAVVIIGIDPDKQICTGAPMACASAAATRSAAVPTPALPEPAVAGLLGVAVLALAGLARRRKLQEVSP